MRRLALLFTLLFALGQDAVGSVTISWTGDTCYNPSVLSFTAAVTGMTAPLSYQWMIDGTLYTFAESPTFTFFTNITTSTVVSVVVTDVNGVMTTDSAAIAFTNTCTDSVTFSGRLYSDQNSNCMYDPGEPVYGSRPLWFTSPYQGTWGMHTDTNGFYSFTASYFDTSYTLQVVQAQMGLWLSPSCANGLVTVFVNPSTDTVYDIALMPTPFSTLSGYVYSDQDGDCQYDLGETTYDSVYVHYQSAGGAYYLSILTDTNGHYSVSLPSDTVYQLSLDAVIGQNTMCPVFGVTSLLLSPTGSTQDFAITILPLAAVSGNIYTDADADCMYDVGETTFPGTPVHFHSLNGSIDVTTYAWANGFYHIMLPYDEYTITVDPSDNFVPTCPASGIAAINLTATPVEQDFAFTCTPGTEPSDLAAIGWATTFSLLQNRWIGIGLQNITGSCIDNGAIVRLTLDSALVPQYFFSTSTLPDSVVGQNIYWHVDAGAALLTLESDLAVLANSSLASIGDTLCSTVTIIHNGPGDASSANDTAIICGLVTGSFDPNDKAVSPQGVGLQGYLPATPQTLSYLIRFQNTGTDTAYNIVVRDTLSANVDWSTLKVLNASHPINMTQGAGGAVAFNFPDILLPDSNVNEAASHGFVAYSVKMHDSLAPGTPIANTAYIYFDNNAAVVTNTTLNTIELQAPTGVQSVPRASATIYPNPANEWLNIASQEYQSAVLTDASGRTLRTASGQGNLRMNVQDLPEGMYWLKFSGTKGTVVRKVAVAH